jgi:hypothetical protein
MIDFFDLRGFSMTQDGNDSILVKSLGGPFFCRRSRVSKQRAHDIDVVGWSVGKVDRGQKDLVTPKDGKTTLARRSVNTSLLDHGFQDGQGISGNGSDKR